MKVSNKTEQSRIYFPKNKHNSKCLYYKIVLHSELTNEEIIIKCVDEKELMDYYVFTLNLKDVRTGEYVYSIFPIYSYYSKTEEKDIEYCLKCDARGLIIVGDYEGSYIEYEPENNAKIHEVIYYE